MPAVNSLGELRVEDTGQIYDKVVEFAHRKEPSDDGSYYVNKSEILKATGLDEEGYKDFVYSCRVYGYMEPTGKWFRLKDIPSLGSISSLGVSAQASQASQVMAMGSIGPANFNLPSQDFDPPGPSQGDMYYNTKLKELRLFDGGQWLSASMSPAAPCP